MNKKKISTIRMLSHDIELFEVDPGILSEGMMGRASAMAQEVLVKLHYGIGRKEHDNVT